MKPRNTDETYGSDLAYETLLSAIDWLRGKFGPDVGFCPLPGYAPKKSQKETPPPDDEGVGPGMLSSEG